MAKNSKMVDKLMDMGKAAAAGAAAQFITVKGADMLKKQNIDVNEKLIHAAPLVASFFLADVKGWFWCRTSTA